MSEWTMDTDAIELSVAMTGSADTLLYRLKQAEKNANSWERREFDLAMRLHAAGYYLPAPPAAATGLEAWDAAQSIVQDLDDLWAEAPGKFHQALCGMHVSNIASLVDGVRTSQPCVEALRGVPNPAAVPELIEAVHECIERAPLGSPIERRLTEAIRNLLKEPEADAKD